ncbi:hypothetical protein [Puniceicoccus vermicola]|uniref:Uncharacterized protein n=1 Tax=Puniceicoccus vermicola TaxID=388746 RepID=A0A7X1E5Q8_9BACT|nr:hypothetical protein [Puniceicoccus vermicola]MBC2601852.1 hypothetical protein [Puniceicoccus vermicola]
MNLYLFNPHPAWKGGQGAVAIAARDFQRAEGIAMREAKKRGVPGVSFSILVEEVEPRAAEGYWVEVERYRDVEDIERLVFFQFGDQEDSEADPSMPKSA